MRRQNRIAACTRSDSLPRIPCSEREREVGTEVDRE
jgi:hypothetical protein